MAATTAEERPLLALRCSACGATGGSLQKCGACKVAHFCGEPCLRAAWKEHKPFCQVARAPSYAARYAELARTAVRALRCLDHLAICLHPVQQGVRLDLERLIEACESGRAPPVADYARRCSCAARAAESADNAAAGGAAPRMGFDDWLQFSGEEDCLREFVISGLCVGCQQVVFPGIAGDTSADGNGGWATLQREEEPLLLAGNSEDGRRTTLPADTVAAFEVSARMLARKTIWADLGRSEPLIVRGEIYQVVDVGDSRSTDPVIESDFDKSLISRDEQRNASGDIIKVVSQRGKATEVSRQALQRYLGLGYLQMGYDEASTVDLHGNVLETVSFEMSYFKRVDPLTRAVCLSRVQGLDIDKCSLKDLSEYSELDALRADDRWHTWVSLLGMMTKTARLRNGGVDVTSLRSWLAGCKRL